MGKRLSEETKTKIVKKIAKPYPAFYNTKTKEFIPAGCNLAKMCRESDLHYENFRGLIIGKMKQSMDGWRLLNTAPGEISNGSPYPAFYNDKTGEFIAAGRNFASLCREYNFNYNTMSSLKSGHTKRAYDGWQLATPEEIEEH